MARWTHNYSPAETAYRRTREYELRNPERYADVMRLMPKEYPGIEYVKKCVMYKYAGQKYAGQKLDKVEQVDVLNMLLAAVAHQEFLAFDRPTYLISTELAELAGSFKLSKDDIEHALEHTPYPTFALLFEKGAFQMHYTNATTNVESVFVTRNYTAAADADTVLFLREKGIDASICIVNDMLIDPIAAGFNGKKLLEHYDTMSESLRAILKLIAALMMLWRARPHLVQDATDKITKDERRYLLGSRKNVRIWNFPVSAIIHKNKTEHTVGTARGPIMPHWRGGHFRHYRHERYEREPDGSVKIAVIQPCFVGVKEEKEVLNDTLRSIPRGQ